MPVNPEYDREYTYDIDAYLIENYPKMNMATRRSVCSLSFEWIDSDFIEEAIDACVSHYAKDKLNISKKEEEDDS